jgi:signal transduction histidine kinase
VEQPPHVGAKFFWFWDIYFAIVYVAVIYVILQPATSESAARRIGAATALTVIALLYGLLGRRQLLNDRHDWLTSTFIASTITLVSAAMWLAPRSQWALFAIIPIVFIGLNLFPAVFFVSTTMFVPVVMSLVQDGATDHLVKSVLPVAAIGTAFSVLIGVWIVRVVSQSFERAELISRLEASQAEVSRLSHETGVAAERERLAGEIHDTLAQGFTSIITLAQAAESELGRDEAQVRKHLELALRTARENLAESRALVAALAPAELTESSVADALRRQADRLTEETGIVAKLVVQGDRRPLPTSVDVVLLRTVQESLANVRKHAQASSVEIVLSYQDTSVVLLVTDDGVGFDPGSDSHGFGLRGMRSRVGHIGGSVSVTSAPGAGTTVELEVCA